MKEEGLEFFKKYLEENPYYKMNFNLNDYRCKKYLDNDENTLWLGYLPRLYNFNKISRYSDAKKEDPELYYLPIKILEQILTKNPRKKNNVHLD